LRAKRRRGIRVAKAGDREREPVEEGKHFPSVREVGETLAAYPEHYAMVATLAFSGIRASELRGLRWRDVKRGKNGGGHLEIRQRANRFGTIGRVKSGYAVRDIQVMPLAINSLERLGRGKPDDLVFGQDDKPLNDDAMMALPPFAKYGRHGYRHFHASWCLARPPMASA
jgi:integrase